MSERKNHSGYHIQSFAGIIVMILGVIVAFIVFHRSNVTRITRQNENYVADIATQRSVLINDLFQENLSYIESAAIVLETEFQNRGVRTDLLNVEDDADLSEEDVQKVADILKVYESRFTFDHLRFIDLKGRDYTTGDNVIAAVVTGRAYFKDGMQGHTGMTYILDSMVTSERQIGFYSPVRQNGELVGIAVGFFGEDFMEELLNVSLFGYACDVLMCDGDGAVIYSTANADAAELDTLRPSFAARQSTLFHYRVDGQQTVGYLSYIGPSSDFFLLLNFPPEAYRQMIANSGNNGVRLLATLIALFALTSVFYIVRFMLQRKRLMEEAKNSNDIHTAMSRLFENFVLVNASSRIYHYIEGMPDGATIQREGAYDLFAEDLLTRFTDERERAEARELIAFERLIKEMNTGANIISYNFHAPIGDEKWFTYNFIVVRRTVAGGVAEFIIARRDITRMQIKEEEETKRILVQARDEAEKGNKAKSDFLSSMSHDIRTPMNAIIGYTNIARDHLDDREMVGDSLNKIASSSHYLLSLINDVLDMSKIESGKLQLHETECDLRDIFERVADLTRSQASKKHLDIRFDADGLKHPLVRVDELRLEQVLINISGNAVKYTPEGGCITIRAVEEDPGTAGKPLSAGASGGTDTALPAELAAAVDPAVPSDPGAQASRRRYRLSVRDTGVGMSEDFLPHIFESFSRETSSTINKIQGTGLGMAITSRLVSLMGGEIAVQSKLGEGSEFTVTLDLETWEKAPETAEDAADGEMPLDLAGRRVLLVEDNDINAEIASLVLSQYGIVTERAVNGQDGVDKVRTGGEGHFDAVLMDIQMPVMNGYDATRAIRGLDGTYFRRLPIIAMSANAYEEDIRASFESGMNGHIAKPFDPEALARELNRQIHRQEENFRL